MEIPRKFLTIKYKVNAFMKEVEKIGNIRVEKNWSCCNSCGHYSMDNTANYIFYDQQTGEFMKETNSCNFAHHFTDKDVKNKVLEIAKKYGSDWNGEDNYTIILTQNHPQNDNLSL